METAVYLTFNLFRMYVVYCFVGAFIKPKDVNKGFIVGAYFIYFLINSSAYLWFHSYLFNICSNIIPLFLITYLYNAKFGQRGFVTFSIYGIGMLEDLVLVTLFQLLNINSIIWESGFVVVFLYYFTALLVRNVISDKFEKISAIKTIYYLALLLVPGLSIVIGYLTIIEWDTWNIKSLIICTILFLLNVLIFYLFDQINDAYQKQQEIESIEQNRRYFQHELKVMEQTQLKTDCLRHDMKNHFLRIEMLAKERNIDEILNYVEQGKEYLNVESQYVATGNKGIDSLLNFKLDEAKKKGIIFTTDMALPDELNITPFDLNTILGNLLDNAMEALDKVSEKKLDISIKYNRNTLTIKIGNSFNGKISENLETTKEDSSKHGLGLKSVQFVVDKYNGLMNYESDNGYFVTKIILYND